MLPYGNVRYQIPQARLPPPAEDHKAVGSLGFTGFALCLPNFI
jgi:hypothetical protein